MFGPRKLGAMPGPFFLKLNGLLVRLFDPSCLGFMSGDDRLSDLLNQLDSERGIGARCVLRIKPFGGRDTTGRRATLTGDIRFDR